MRLIFLLALATLAVTTRLLPLSSSQYPFNNDGITECRIASDILQTRSLGFPSDAYYADTHSVITPAYNVLLAYVASAIGVTPFQVAQICVAIFSVLTVTCGYRIAQKISGSSKGALMTGLFLSLFGTFVFLTGSTWKESLGVAMWLLLILAYMKRNDPRMLALEVVILALLPLIHHLVTLMALLTILYLTAWSIAFAVMYGKLKRRHYIDLAVGVLALSGTYLYYSRESLERLSYFSTLEGFLAIGTAFMAMSLLAILALRKRTHLKLTFAPVPAAVVLGLFLWDHFYPIFPYESGFSDYVILLSLTMVTLICVSWLGFEDILESRSLYRAIPLGLLLPALTIMAFALMSGVGLGSQQILYRSFDFGDPAIALGISVGLLHFSRRPRIEKAVVLGLLVALLVSFPFAYGTGTLIGVRHDTQAYEVDAIEWVHENGEPASIVISDERVSYVATALYDYEKKADLPSYLQGDFPLIAQAVYLYEEDWTVGGVNNFPYGHPVINPAHADLLIFEANVLYVGGPAEDHLVVFRSSTVAE